MKDFCSRLLSFWAGLLEQKKTAGPFLHHWKARGTKINEGALDWALASFTGWAGTMCSKLHRRHKWCSSQISATEFKTFTITNNSILLYSLKILLSSAMTWKNNFILGKATGIVTTTRISHATPAPLYSHSASRYWEDDGKVPPNYRRHCKDIVRQLVEDDPGRNINVSKIWCLLKITKIIVLTSIFTLSWLRYKIFSFWNCYWTLQNIFTWLIDF